MNALGNPFGYWVGGVAIGYRFRDKLPPWLKKALRVVAILSLLPIAVAVSRNVGSSAGLRSPASVPTRMLTKVAAPPTPKNASPAAMKTPPFEILKRLREEDARREPELQKQAVRDAIRDAHGYGWKLQQVKGADGKTYNTFSLDVTPHNERKGPFCRVTCLVHHGRAYDVETDATLCKANWIPPDADLVPGWVNGGEYDYRQPWPGPGPKGNEFQSYKLYWK